MIVKMLKRLAFTALAAFLFFAATTVAQDKNRIVASPEAINSVKSSPAYAEVILRRTELQADLESFTPDYTEENPKIVDIRFELKLLIEANDRLFSVRPTEMSKLTLALGRMMVREIGLEVELHRLQRTYNADHPDVKRAKRKVDIYKAAIKEILG
jgi:hypothetical protein